jgi:hypothetical protein
MNAEIAQKWVEALTSGEYKQTRRALKSIEGFCCLGVLCEIYKKETGGGQWVGNHFQLYNENLDLISSTASILPQKVADWAGMGTRFGSCGDNDTLVALNDMGKSFETIAEVIKKNVEVL